MTASIQTQRGISLSYEEELRKLMEDTKLNCQ